MIDLRSDTVTRPSAAMLQAMVAAPLGDDVMGDDPTVIRLQEAVAARAGKEAGLFFPSGTQSNLGALMAHCGRGDEYLVGQLAHTYKYEGGGAAVLGSIQPQPIEHAEDGTLPLEKLAAALKPADDAHFARTRLLALENTFHGKLIPAAYVQAATDWARRHGLATHLDDLDSKLGGLHPSDLLILAGRPSMGKTALATNIAFNVARNYRWEPTPDGGRKTVDGGVVAFYSLEMSAEQLAMRILADASGARMGGADPRRMGHAIGY